MLRHVRPRSQTATPQYPLRPRHGTFHHFGRHGLNQLGLPSWANQTQNCKGGKTSRKRQPDDRSPPQDHGRGPPRRADAVRPNLEAEGRKDLRKPSGPLGISEPAGATGPVSREKSLISAARGGTRAERQRGRGGLNAPVRVPPSAWLIWKRRARLPDPGVDLPRAAERVPAHPNAR